MMTLEELETLYLKRHFIVAFNEIKNDETLVCFFDLLEKIIKSNSIEDNLSSYVKFYSNLIKSDNSSDGDFSCYLKTLILNYKIEYQKDGAIKKELGYFKNLSQISFNTIKNIFVKKFPKYQKLFLQMPKYKNSKFDVDYNKLTTLKQNNNNVFDESKTFIFDSDLKIIPVELSQNIDFSYLKGYKTQKKILKDNTVAFLNNKKVSNILLYGDTGCGKSSSVRALLGELKDYNNLKMIQVFKNNLSNLDKLFLMLKNLPYKFIIFLDDLTFEGDDDALSNLKALIEGSIIQCPNNCVIYVTSNRRHLVKETFSDRYGSEIHLNDTINEYSALYERFGINLLFLRPNNDEFNSIVLEIAKENNINLDDETLIKKAQKYALLKASKSPRIIRQFIDNLLNDIEM